MPLALAVPGRHNARNATAALSRSSPLATTPPRPPMPWDISRGRPAIRDERRGQRRLGDRRLCPSPARDRGQSARRERALSRPASVGRLPAAHIFADESAAATISPSRSPTRTGLMILDIYAARETDDLGYRRVDLSSLLPADTACRARARRTRPTLPPGSRQATSSSRSAPGASPTPGRCCSISSVELSYWNQPCSEQPRRRAQASESVHVPGHPD